MIKTSTPNEIVSSPNAKPTKNKAKEIEQHDELFYNSIKSQLNMLVKDPSDETVEKILAYSKDK
jgi:hypothetical protein